MVLTDFCSPSMSEMQRVAVEVGEFEVITEGDSPMKCYLMTIAMMRSISSLLAFYLTN